LIKDPARATFCAMNEFSHYIKFIAQVVLAAAAFAGLFWLLFPQLLN
jgi:hypothetical protein